MTLVCVFHGISEIWDKQQLVIASSIVSAAIILTWGHVQFV